MSKAPINLVRIVITDHAAIVKDGVPLVESILRVAVRRFEAAPDGSTSAVQDIEVFGRQRLGRLWFSPGLVPFVVSELKARGIQVEVDDRRALPPELTVPAEFLASAAGRDRRMLEALARESRGQFEIDRRADLVQAIRVIGRSFPSCNILVLSGTIRRARQLWRSLVWSFPGQVQLARGTWSKRRRIVCSTYCYACDASQWQIILLTDAHELANSAVVEKVSTALRGPQRLYAFVRRGWQPRPLEAMAVQNVAGPVIHRTQSDPARINLQICRAAEFQLPQTQPGLEHKRRLWHHDARNNLIARIATAFAHQDTATLWELGIMLDESDTRWLTEVGDNIKVAVLVESTEHGTALQQRLADWPLLTLVPTEEPEVALGDLGRSGPGTIVTQAFAHHYGLPVDVLIRADGSDKLAVRRFPPPAMSARGGIVTVVELDDGLTRPLPPERQRQDRHVKPGRKAQADTTDKVRRTTTATVKRKTKTTTKQPRPGRSRQSDPGDSGDTGTNLPSHPVAAGSGAATATVPQPAAPATPVPPDTGDDPRRSVLTRSTPTGRYSETGVRVRLTCTGTDRHGRATGSAMFPEGSAVQAAISGERPGNHAGAA